MAFTSINPDAELDAINDVLSAIGEPAVTSLIGADDDADVQNARRSLGNANREVQSEGFSFNTIQSFTLTPDFFHKNIPYLPSYLRVMATSGQSIYVNRNGLFFDMTTGSDEFTSPITVKMIIEQPFDVMPQCFQKLIKTRASRQFNARFYGDTVVDSILQEEEALANRLCFEYEMDFGQFNMLSGDAFTGGQLSRS